MASRTLLCHVFKAVQFYWLKVRRADNRSARPIRLRTRSCALGLKRVSKIDPCSFYWPPLLHFAHPCAYRTVSHKHTLVSDLMRRPSWLREAAIFQYSPSSIGRLPFRRIPIRIEQSTTLAGYTPQWNCTFSGRVANRFRHLDLVRKNGVMQCEVQHSVGSTRFAVHPFVHSD
jgi:hypothetical protein